MIMDTHTRTQTARKQNASGTVVTVEEAEKSNSKFPMTGSFFSHTSGNG